MIIELTYVNPITQDNDKFIIKYPVINYLDFKSDIDFKNDSDICKILDDIIKNMDCTIEYSCGRPMTTNCFNYSRCSSNYYRYLLKITNQFLYNKYVNKLIKRHIDNIIFEHEHPYIQHIKSNKKKKLPPNIYVRYISHDIFTGDIVYFYCNHRTKDEIKSSNPDLLNVLNATKNKKNKKHIKTKSIGVPIDAMTFNFKKK